MSRAEAWFESRGWKPFSYQKKVWKAYAEGKSGLVHAETGTGKTYSIWMAVLEQAFKAEAKSGESVIPGSVSAERSPFSSGNFPVSKKKAEKNGTAKSAGLKVLWLTPLRALANDLLKAMQRPLEDMGLPWSVEIRTGDVSSSVKARQRTKLPHALITTPESLSLLLSYPESEKQMNGIECVVVDEWHELLGSKRGVQTELCLARLRRWNPGIRIWGLSATIGNLEEAMEVLLGGSKEGILIEGPKQKKIEITTLIPETMERFPWAGHIGLKMMDGVLERIEAASSTLVFTNVRSAAEIWYYEILERRPDWAGLIALHHGSIDRKIREWVEKAVSAGRLKCVVCTSSLDLGVDFAPVEQAIQIGSPKGIARLTQRAGRSGHRPGAESRVFCVPAHAFELAEFAVVREMSERREMESRAPLKRPLDVLSQHLVTIALGTGFSEDEMLAEIKSAFAYRDITREEWEWTLEFVSGTGNILRNYPQYRRIEKNGNGYHASGEFPHRFHRMSIGTITADAQLMVKFLKGGKLGTIEENFITKLKKGDTFLFAGRALQLVMIRDMTVYVRKGSASRAVARWLGGKLPLSESLGQGVRRKLEEAARGRARDPEMRALKPLIELQKRVSEIPDADEILIELIKTREGRHHFIYPFAGRAAHEGLGALLAYRVSKKVPISISVMATDYGLDLTSNQKIDLDEAGWRALFTPENLVDDLLGCLNMTELAKHRFRDIAQIAGLVFKGYPGGSKTNRQLQASSSLFYEVFTERDPENRLLGQARTEVLEAQLEVERLRRTMSQVHGQKILIVEPSQLTPLSFPVWADEIRARVSSESWSERIKRMAVELEAKNAG